MEIRKNNKEILLEVNSQYGVVLEESASKLTKGTGQVLKEGPHSWIYQS